MLKDRKLQEISILLRQTNTAEADTQLSALLAELPPDSTMHKAVALLASQTDRIALALHHMDIACRLAPADIQSKFQLGCLLAHDRQFQRSLEYFNATTAQLPTFVDGWYFLGIALGRLGRDVEALPALRAAHQLAPGEIKILNALAEAEFRTGYPADALPLWQQLLGQKPDDIDFRLKTGETLSRLGYHQQAIALYQEGTTTHPRAESLWMALAQAQEDDGNRAAAQHAYEQALALRPGWAFPLSGLLGLKRGSASNDWVELATTLRASPALPDADRALLGYELGKVYDSRGEYDEAISCWQDANAARQRMTGKLEPSWLSRRVEETISACPRELFSHPEEQWDDDGSRFVFIVGMPRSGTTLTEQIIANHPQAFGCGELPDIALIARNLPAQLNSPQAWPQIAGALTPASLLHAITRYTQAATRHAPADALRLVDKAPLNFFHLGLIALMFPRSRVIWCRRDPRDVAVSIYGENFSLEERLATSFAGIGHYFNAQDRLMRHWQSTLKIPILELRYEELVTSLEAQSRRLIEFIDLPWSDACLDFHQSDRGVQTPSRWQVRQPVHTRSIGRWKNYADALRPLLDVLNPKVDY
ncbi:MAG: sulfotransferase [Lysobacter sp.]